MVELQNVKLNAWYLVTAVAVIAISGLFFGITYYVMDNIETTLEGTNCIIENNYFVANCQELWTMTVYPFLALKNILIWFSYFFIFGSVLSIFILGYNSGKSTSTIGIFVLLIIGLTYGAIEISNQYRSLLEIPIIYTMLTPFTVYNFIMWNFPTFIFVVSLIGFILSIINFQKSPVNKVTEDSFDF